MAYEREGRNTALPLHVSKPVGQVNATADLPSGAQYSQAESAGPGAVSVVGRPVSTFDTLPAGTNKFRLNYEYTLPLDVEYGELLTIAEFKAPKGRVMVIESWEIRFVPYDAGQAGRPRYTARIMNTKPIRASITRNRQKQQGASDVNFWPFDGEAGCHVIIYGDQLGAVIAEAATPLDWQDNPQKLEIILSGNYLLPNLQAPEYTELEVGVVRMTK